MHKGTAKKYVCILCGKALSLTKALHTHEKSTKIIKKEKKKKEKKKKKPNSKFRTFGPDIYIVFFWPHFLLLPPPPPPLAWAMLEYVWNMLVLHASPKGNHMPWSCTLYLTSVQNF